MAAPIVCQCPSCAARFKVDAAYEGRKIKCPKCSTPVLVAPGAAGPPPVAAAPTAAPGVVPPVAKPPQARPPLPRPAAAPPLARPAVAVAAPVLPPAAPPMAQPVAPMAVPQAALPVAPTAESPVAALFSMPSAPQVVVQTAPVASTGSAIRPKKKNGLPIALLAVGGVLGLAVVAGLVVAAVLMFGDGGDQVAKGKKGKGGPTGGKAELILDWPESDRRGAAVTIDGDTQSVRASGDVKFALTPGEHTVLIRRRGFEPIEAKVTLAAGETERFSPSFKASEVAAAVAPAATTESTSSINLSTGGGTPFQIGGAASTSPRGFVGFVQTLSEAKREAQKANKSILIVFGSSDADEDTQELASLMQAPDFKQFMNETLVPVVIDFPRTRDGYNLVQDTAQNAGLLEEYQVQSLPTLVLADAMAKPYFIQRDWEGGYGDLTNRVKGWLDERQKRDELIQSAQADSDETMPAAAAAVKWIDERKLWGPYEAELTGFHDKARQRDPNNDKGLLEVFVEGAFFTRLVEVQEGDHTGVDLLKHILEPLTKNGCKDPDRGAKLHLVMAMQLRAINRTEQAEMHLAKAAGYMPKDKELAQAMATLRQALENKDVLSSGTGFLISEAGYMLTNHHVVEGDGKVQVSVPGQEEPVTAEVIAQDADRDMALIKVELPSDSKVTPISLSDAAVRRGSPVAAFGYPLGVVIGKGLKLTTGVVSSPPDGTAENMILLDLRVNPGNSGGPLCDSRGNVVGMVTAKTSALGVDSYGMALPAAELLKFLEANLPADAARPEAAESDEPLSWDNVDQKVSPAVLMITKVRS